MEELPENSIFFSWHLSQRSKSLANRLGLKLLAIQPEGNSFYRFSICVIWTIYQLIKTRPKFIILQYSFLFLIILSIYKRLSSQKILLVCDCHTKALKRSITGILSGLFQRLKQWSFLKCDLCIIHNTELSSEIKLLNKNYIVLHDPLPTFFLQPIIDNNDLSQGLKEKIVFICSYDKDEPIKEILVAAKELSEKYQVYLTGKTPKKLASFKNNNLHFTGYLEDIKYQKLLTQASVIISLTTESACLQCAAFEAMVVNKPLVTSDTNALRSLLGSAAIYVKNQSPIIINGVEQALIKKERLKNELLIQKNKLEKEFDSKISIITSVN